MTVESKGRDLFIVDNSVSGWTGLRYLEEWTGIAKAFDIATGYFEIGALLALDGKWQGLEKIRILMGAEMTSRTRKALLDAVRERAVQILDGSIEANKDTNPFLHGVPAVIEAMRAGQIECRVYDKDKFHAKAYITHAKLEVIGSQALVGSSNFTSPGLTKNIELNIQVQSAREVAQLQEWFEIHWNDASNVTDAVIETISRHTHPYTPCDVYAKALQEFFRGHELTATEWDETRSKMFPRIDRYQKEAYWALMKIARQHGGAFLCDGVGLGKTFVGLMLIERLVLHEGKRVVLFAPKATKEGVWEPQGHPVPAAHRAAGSERALRQLRATHPAQGRCRRVQRSPAHRGRWLRVGRCRDQAPPAPRHVRGPGGRQVHGARYPRRLALPLHCAGHGHPPGQDGVRATARRH